MPKKTGTEVPAIIRWYHIFLFRFWFSISKL